MTIPNVDYAGNIAKLAKATATRILNTEKDVAANAKDWGCNVLNLVRVHGGNMDVIVENTKKAAGWPGLKGPAGNKVKQALSKWFSDIRTCNGRWDDLPEEVRTALLGGTRSFLSVIEAMRKADREAAKKSEASEAAAANADATNPETGPASGPVNVNREALQGFLSALSALDDSELLAFGDEFVAMQELCNRFAAIPVTEEQRQAA